MAFVNTKIVNEFPVPDPESAKSLMGIISGRSKNQLPQYWTENILDFRSLEPKFGPIENGVKVLMPFSKVGSWLLVSHSFHFPSPFHFVSIVTYRFHAESWFSIPSEPQPKKHGTVNLSDTGRILNWSPVPSSTLAFAFSWCCL